MHSTTIPSVRTHNTQQNLQAQRPRASPPRQQLAATTSLVAAPSQPTRPSCELPTFTRAQPLPVASRPSVWFRVSTPPRQARAEKEACSQRATALKLPSAAVEASGN